MLTGHGASTTGDGLANLRTNPADETSDDWNLIRADAGRAARSSGPDDRRYGRTPDHRLTFRLRPVSVGFDGILAVFDNRGTHFCKAFRYLRPQVVPARWRRRFRVDLRPLWRCG